jgi:hypothetical protein
MLQITLATRISEEEYSCPSHLVIERLLIEYTSFSIAFGLARTAPIRAMQLDVLPVAAYELAEIYPPT